MTRFTVEPGGGSAYLQLYRYLKEALSAGVYPAGTRIPSKRALAQETGLSLITVEHALALLVDEGYLEPRQRSGFFALGRTAPPAPPPAPLSEMSLPARVPEDFPLSTLQKIMRRTISEQGERLLSPSPPLGTQELRGAIGRYLLRTRGLIAPEERILIGSGAEYLYAILAQLFGRGTVFAIEEPSYAKIRQVYEASGAECVGLPMGRDGIERAALETCTAGVLHVTPYRSYPSGITAGAEKRAAYAAWAGAHNAYLIEEDYDAGLGAPPGRIETLCALAPERTAYLSTFSKTLAPSFRTGFLLLPEALAARYRTLLGFYSCSVPVFEQHVLAAFIESGELERLTNRRRKKAAKSARA